MKKTLTTLAVLAVASPCVMAATDYTFTVPTGGNFYAADFSFDFVITEDINLGTETVIAGYSGSAPEDAQGANYVTIKVESNGQYTMIVGRGSLTWDSTTQTATNKEYDGQRYTQQGLNLAFDTVYTLSGVGADGSMKISLMQGETVIHAFLYNGNGYNGNMNGGNANTTMTTYYDQRFNPANAVPEPATATLSLLALAGLTARRRRK